MLSAILTILSNLLLRWFPPCHRMGFYFVKNVDVSKWKMSVKKQNIGATFIGKICLLFAKNRGFW